ncbi:AAA family ATPase [Caballeronia sp. LZ034LL]|uniref:AAA family ATPase n=1 Tax=Caballeronia sp. LZ034LL TaxID=3038567 RepID=UPI00285E72BF|nr:AAA family ATPase [Caballeronia sp. LZ034LL]MDR5839308.1 AAA family ATPase [Caballeronia sp. LZ034LL]
MSEAATADEVEQLGEPNDQLIMIAGYSGEGKSASLRNILNQERWVYLNCEAGKRLPFRNKFMNVRITDPYEVFSYFDECTANKDDVDGIIIDSVTFLLDMFESLYIAGAANGQAAWGAFAQYFKTLMQQKVTLFGKPVIIIAHLLDVYDEASQSMKISVPVKGSLKNNGLEAYFSTVVAARKIPLKELEKFGNKLLDITEEERELGYKHVFQTRPTKQTTGMRIRSPMGMFPKEQTYIDNDAQKLLDHLNEFYDI